VLSVTPAPLACTTYPTVPCDADEALDTPLITGVVSVLFVKVSVVARPTKVSVEVGRVSVPVFEIVDMIGVVSVLLVSVSVVARPTRVSVLVGRVSVPVFEIVAITGAVSVLLVSVSDAVRLTSVPEVGNVTLVEPEVVRVTSLFTVVKLPPRVTTRLASTVSKASVRVAVCVVVACVLRIVRL